MLQFYSEIECAFLIKGSPVDDIINACRFLKVKGFDLNLQDPGYGYVNDEGFEYPVWISLDQAYKQIKKRGYESFCINFHRTDSKNDAVNKLSLVADTETKSISLILG